MGETSVFDLKANTTLLKTLKNDVIMVALNFSRSEENFESLGDFHDPCPWANDFKIRYAFEDTPF